MASAAIYPPLVDSYTPAFIASDGYCRIYFSMSKVSFTSTSGINSLHVSVINQQNGQNVVNRTGLRKTGIILNVPINKVEDKDNLYYFDLLKDDIKGGWDTKVIYKVQIRCSTIEYRGDGNNQSRWLQDNANQFSEWSTYCTIKPIGKIGISIPIFNFETKDVNAVDSNKETKYKLYSSTLEFTGEYSNEEPSEILYSYNVTLYNKAGTILDHSDELFTNQLCGPNQFYYLFKYEFSEDDEQDLFTLELNYTTINKYNGTLTIPFSSMVVSGDFADIKVTTVDNNSNINSSIAQENEEGRIALKLVNTSAHGDIYTGNLCIRRSDSRDNFTSWTDIKIIPCNHENINDLPMIYDYTIENGVWYKYGVQNIVVRGLNKIVRGPLNITEAPIIRDFEYSYLLGEGGRQLKLNFNNNISSYAYNYSESKLDTIGGQYPFITRNGNMKYRTFPLSCLISFNMDDMHTFMPADDTSFYNGHSSDVEHKGKKVNKIQIPFSNKYNNRQSGMYDYKREFDFREEVLAFLQDGKPKLFKSATEGNIIVRLMQVTEQPNQQLNRMIGTFNSQAHEIAAATMENYAKYNLLEVGECQTNFVKTITKLGQVVIENNGTISEIDILNLIKTKYDHSNENIGGNRYVLKKIYNLSFEFDGIAEAFSDGRIGNIIKYSNSDIFVNYDSSRVYSLDKIVSFTTFTDNTLMARAEYLMVNFLYDIDVEVYQEKAILEESVIKGVGQIRGRFDSGTNLYNEVRSKYFYDWDTSFSKLAQITWTCIEANPGSVFAIQDEADEYGKYEMHVMNETGILNLEGLGVIRGLRYEGTIIDGELNTEEPCDVIIDYIYYKKTGIYETPVLKEA